MTGDVEQVAQRYARYTALGAAVITGLWHLGYDLTVTVAGWHAFRRPMLVAAAWTGYTAIALIATLSLARTSRGPARIRELAVAALAVDVAVIVACRPGDLLGAADWGWGSVGWLGVMLVWDRPRWRAELVAFLAANAGIMLTAMVVTGTLDRVSVAKYLVVIVGGITMQLGYTAGCHTLRARAEDAVLLARRLAADDAWRESAWRIHADRLRRYDAIRDAAESLLERLADGADPGDPRVRRDCTAGAMRLRRLITEREDVPDALVSVLRERIDAAERRKVLVAAPPFGGNLPDLPAGVREDLLRAPVRALDGARSRARVTVSAMSTMVSVAVVADNDDLPVSATPVHEPSGVVVTYQRQGGEVWVNSIWQPP
ncbi:hypothetical protein GCM10010156_69590 [Planobispora rosea]|uniref:NanT5 n=1 Tax=Planobispora rosea TaxID=35762 RepID=A0A8J3WFP2_PLARO|nr:hypothetical protein [Planobispora rosea]GGT01736.1 hypothetical protein GCM10010156_69590 [Planobispora rosea]GIH88384.1 hypothetical protein Pro02_67920 [Planobispora rosea]